MKKIVPNKTFLAVFAFGVASSMTRVSHADVDYFGAYGDARTQSSPQTMAIELRVGRYLPNVDDEFGGGATPFEDHFGRKQRWMVGMELDWQLLQMEGIGSLGPGVGFGYTSLTSRDFHDAPGSPDRQEAAEGSTLKILPLYAVAVLRIDALAQRTPVPLAFYGKGGFSYAYWWATYSQGLDRVEGTKSSDTSWGTTWALGVSLLLDALDRRAANNMDASNGINNSYVFLEWYNSDLSGFGSNKMQVGDSTWVAGLAFEL